MVLQLLSTKLIGLGENKMKPQHLYWDGEEKICMTENPECSQKAVWLVEYDSEYFFLCKKHYLEWDLS